MKHNPSFSWAEPKNIIQWAILLIVGCFLGFLLTKYLVSILGALVFYVLLSPWYTQRTRHKPKSASWTALWMMGLTFICILLPTVWLGYLLVQKIGSISDSPLLYDHLIQKLEFLLKTYLHIDILQEKYWSQIQSTVAEWISVGIQGTMGLMGDVALMYFLLYYALVEQKRWKGYVHRFFPYQKRYLPFFIREIRSHILSNAIGSPLLALVQSIFAYLCFWWFDVPDALFWSLVCGVFSFIPLVGTALVWVPVGLYFMVNGNWTSAIFVWVYGLVVISNVDNVFRFVFQKRFADIHPVITVMGILLGLPLFGALGIIFGPMVLSLFLLMVRIQFSWKG